MASSGQNPATSLPPRRWRGLLLVLLPVLALAAVGALQLAFLCDDAFITFRYVDQARRGHGLVWNPPPFLPVEGYTSFLWAVLLWAGWSLFGAAPPVAANAMSLVLGLLQLVVVGLWAERLRSRDGRLLPIGVTLAVLVAVAGQRTFLSWCSSGLETALFNLLFVGWTLLAFTASERRTPRWLSWWSAAAALAALTRPDGLLFVAATAACGGLAALQDPGRRRRWLLALLPLCAVAAHLLWRRACYGEWLPNTYYAKVTGSWPEAGLRYFLCFAVEHGVWLFVPLCLLWAWVALRRAGSAAAAIGRLRTHLPAVVAVAAVLFHAGYYTFVVGGDHFEYRVYSQLVPLAALAAAAMSAQLWRGSWPAALWPLLLLVAASVGWLHLAWTQYLPPHGYCRIAHRLPAALQPLGRWFDRQQAWLRLRMIGLRTNHHALFLAQKRRDFPHRMPIEGAQDPFPVFAAGAVGLPGWTLPGAVVVDLHGLNDWVVARTPVRDYGAPPGPDALRQLHAQGDRDGDGLLSRDELRALLRLINPDGVAAPAGEADEAEYLAEILLAIHARAQPDALTAEDCAAIGPSLQGARSMAHERLPPAGYVEELQPNVVVEGGRAVAAPRAVPLDRAAIEAFEQRWRARVDER